ncbi:MAG: OB-fold nucleic acid binding domain-containing protein, partial [Chitinophagales bacterium]
MQLEPFQYISKLSAFEGKEIELRGWVSNKRESKGLVFIILRDGSGFAQCVVDEQTISASTFEAAKKLTLESSLTLQGTVVKDTKQIGGYEVKVTSLKV